MRPFLGERGLVYHNIQLEREGGYRQPGVESHCELPSLMWQFYVDLIVASFGLEIDTTARHENSAYFERDLSIEGACDGTVFAVAGPANIDVSLRNVDFHR